MGHGEAGVLPRCGQDRLRPRCRNRPAELLGWARKNPGRFTYPQPPDFIGSSFLKQVASEFVADRGVLMKPVDEATFVTSTAPLFAYLDAAQPAAVARRQGLSAELSGDEAIARRRRGRHHFRLQPVGSVSAIAAGELPDTVRSFTFPGGTLSNAHFVAIPYNAAAKAGALVLADFLISPEAQARKQDPKVWGDPTVLDVAKLRPQDKARFDALDLGVATLKPDELGPALDEPHPSWMERLETEWKRRYGAAN